MTMFETKQEIEEALYIGAPLSFDSMINCYSVIKDALDNKAVTDQLVDKVASYFERNDKHWHQLHTCWIVNGRSDDLRALLREALNDD